jgi:Skp family chaperone for outer membrane proteins
MKQALTLVAGLLAMIGVLGLVLPLSANAEGYWIEQERRALQYEREGVNHERQQMHRDFDAMMRDLDEENRAIDRWQNHQHQRSGDHQHIAHLANQKREALNRERDRLNRERDQMNRFYDEQNQAIDRRSQHLDQGRAYRN